MGNTDILARQIAREILQMILQKKQSLDEVLAKHEGLASLEKRDRAFVHALVALCLRRLGQIDDLINHCLARSKDIKPAVKDILRLGVAQLVFLGTPSHAAVDTSVEMAASQNATQPFKGLVNAVLRRLSREGKDLVQKQDAARLNTARWLWEAWCTTYGEKKARQIALANMGEALMDLSVKAEPEKWAEKLGARLLPNGSLRLSSSGPVKEMEGFEEGAWWVQDVAASLPVSLLGDVKGKTVFDLCAAPGGKAMQLAARGARVTAVDRSAKRLERLRENVQRLGLDVEIVCSDALKWAPKEKAEIILLDAPCSATGTIRRHPDVPYLKKPDDVARMADLQQRLLEKTAADFLADKGLLLYAVCSLQPEEGEQQIESFLKAHPDFRREPLLSKDVFGANELLTQAGDLRCLPCHWDAIGGMDGFYAARLVRG